ncbi:MAG: PQQ-dependent sugar dehydrogenase [Proteobacteria bacterium]|nr:PQQ-dependent sugar dehydrogenase [Pseudomonadota bacterium]
MRAGLVGLVVLSLASCKDTPKPTTHDDAPIALPDAAPPGLLACTTTAGSTISTRLVGKVLGGATLATSPPADPRLFVVEQTGRIRIFEPTRLVDAPFLDISADAGGQVVAGGEMGLLGLAFHPQYATNRQFFVYYTAQNPDRVNDPHNPYLDTIVRYTASPTDPNVADPASATTILAIPDFASNHNGGMIEFGADGMLYVGTGEGGGGGDPDRNGQNRHALLAKILRVDVDHPTGGKPYGIPADSPYFDGVAGAPEVWLYGVRNPWRWTFDRGNGDLWIGDVGQGVTEEVDVLRAGQQAGKNLGWSVYEGATCCQNTADRCQQGTANPQPCVAAGMTGAQDERTHAAGWRAIIGGQVYRGTCFPDLVGWYVYTDNARAQLVKARLRPDDTLEVVDLPVPPGGWPVSPASIHADARGELFLTTTSGGVYMVQAGP